MNQRQPNTLSGSHQGRNEKNMLRTWKGYCSKADVKETTSSAEEEAETEIRDATRNTTEETTRGTAVMLEANIVRRKRSRCWPKQKIVESSIESEKTKKTFF